MAKSSFKIPFIHRALRGSYFLDKFDDEKSRLFWNRNSTINEISMHKNMRIKIHNGVTFLSLFLKEELAGFKLGAFIITRLKPPHKGKVKVKKKK